MIRKLIAVAFTVFATSSAVHAQEMLDTEKYRDAEVFVLKKGYDVSQRLQEIESIAGNIVTVCEVSGKQNKIKLTYTGVAEESRVQKFSDKQKASLIVVRTKTENGRNSAYFPLTNDKNYRIYLTEKMK